MKNSDPTAELRGKILALTFTCPKGNYEVDCPFRMFHGLCDGTKKNTLAHMDYTAMLKLFDYSHSCACPADPRQAVNEFLMGGADI